MFKNFGKVFRFTFHNQVSPASYKTLTITLALIFFLLPAGLLVLLSASANKDKDKKLESCGAEKIYVADMIAKDVSFEALKTIDGEGYGDITYVTVADVDEGLSRIKDAGEKKSFVLEITENDTKEVSAGIILPEGSSITGEQAKHFYDAIDRKEMMFVVLARGISMQDMVEIQKTIGVDTYNASGWSKGDSLKNDEKVANESNNQRILDIFNVIIILLSVIVMYIVIIMYGGSISKNIVMEKSSKLMDTLLISVKPEAMIFGKMTGVLTAGLLQLMIWLAALALGVFAGVKFSDIFFPNAHSSVIVFLKSFGSLDIFEIGQVILAVVVLLFGIILYCAMAAFAGAISSTQEQAVSNQSMFMIVLIASYFIVMMKGMNVGDTPEWMYLIPFTAALCLPAGLLLNTVSAGVAAASVSILIVLALLFVVIAGRVYKAMALFRGEQVSIAKAFKMMSMSK